MRLIPITAATILCFLSPQQTQAESYRFDANLWQVDAEESEFMTHLGQPALKLKGGDAVLSDIKMPGKSGIELMGELRELRPATPVVLMTAFGSINTAVDAMRASSPFPPMPDRVRCLANKNINATFSSSSVAG